MRIDEAARIDWIIYIYKYIKNICLWCMYIKNSFHQALQDLNVPFFFIGILWLQKASYPERRCCFFGLVKISQWNPAAPGMYKTLQIMGYSPYQIVQDFWTINSINSQCVYFAWLLPFLCSLTGHQLLPKHNILNERQFSIVQDVKNGFTRFTTQNMFKKRFVFLQKHHPKQ